MENYNELYHHGVKGMRWGVRKARGHAGPGIYATKKRKLDGYKKDLEVLDNGGHLSVGITKKRQEMYDKRDRAKLEKNISKLENKQAKKPRVSEDAARVQQIRKKSLSEMSNQELRDLNNRLNLERQYKDLTKKKSKGQKAVGAFIKTAGTIVAIEAAAKTYKRVGTAVMGKIGNMAIDSFIK